MPQSMRSNECKPDTGIIKGRLRVIQDTRDRLRSFGLCKKVLPSCLNSLCKPLGVLGLLLHQTCSHETQREIRILREKIILYTAYTNKLYIHRHIPYIHTLPVYTHTDCTHTVYIHTHSLTTYQRLSSLSMFDG